MNVEKLVFDYLKENNTKGLTFKEIYDQVLGEIQSLDDQLKDLDRLRIQRAQKQKIAEKFSAMLQVNKISDSFDDNSEEAKEISKKIVQIVDKQAPLSNRDIMLEFGSYNQDAKIIRAIKKLADFGILEKDINRKIIPGDKWEDRNKYI